MVVYYPVVYSNIAKLKFKYLMYTGTVQIHVN